MIDTVKLVSLYDELFPKAKLDNAAAAGLRLLAGKLHTDPAMTDQRWRAYALATVRTETARTFEPIYERGPVSYFDKYEPGTHLGDMLGNTQPGDGYLFRGRGYVQPTGRGNYRTFSALVEVDLLANPDAALDPEISYKILSVGMTRGKFTGKALRDFIHGDTCDLFNSRRIINSLNLAAAIAADARLFMQALAACEQ